MNEKVTSFFLVAYGISLLLTLVNVHTAPPCRSADRSSKASASSAQHRLPSCCWWHCTSGGGIPDRGVTRIPHHLNGWQCITKLASLAVAAVSELPVFTRIVLYRKVGPDRLSHINRLYAVRMLLPPWCRPEA